MCPIAAQAFELLFLKYTQKLRLQRRWNIAHLVQKKRAFVGEFETADLLRYGSVNAPFSWPKRSLSNRSKGIAAQFNFMNARPHRELRL
jgi:hypothetical protein